jgi:HTH-type transcriptional regulator, competence development regulator
METFGERIKRERRAKKKTQRDVADKLEVDFTYISKLENDELPPPAEDKIKALAKYLEINSDELFLLAQKTPTDVARLAREPQMPTILRAAKDLTEDDKTALLRWIENRRAKKAAK